jgi:hypothetical protein
MWNLYQVHPEVVCVEDVELFHGLEVFFAFFRNLSDLKESKFSLVL